MLTVINTAASVANYRARQRNEMRLPVSLSDSELIERCNHGDEAAWNVLVRRYERTIYRFAYKLCRDYDESADLAGHVLLQVYENLQTFRNEGCFSSWLFRVVRNSFLDLYVRPAYRKLETHSSLIANQDGQCPEVEIADPHPSPEQICVGNDIARVLSKAVSELPAYVRRPMKMRARGASYSQIAEATGVNMGTVKSRLNRGRTMLRERLPRLEELLTAN